jgi:Ser/Thr protein kinase RdoA (MazF antagonist)
MTTRDPEEPLRGLITAAVRVGPTVRRPAVPVADALLTHLEAVGFTGAPRYLGRDEQDRSVLSWVDGWCPTQPEDHLISEEALHAVGALLRRYHDAVADYRPAGPAAEFEEGPRVREPGQVVCHGDIAPRNTVFRGGLPVAFIDWDGIWISDPLWDVGYAIWQFAPLRDDAGVRKTGWPNLPDRLARAAALADGYGLDRAARERVPAWIAPMIRACAASIVAKAEAGQPAFVRLANGVEGAGQARAPGEAGGVLADMEAEARYAASQEPALRRRLLAGTGG